MSRSGQGELAEKKLLLANDPIQVCRPRVDGHRSDGIASLRAARTRGRERTVERTRLIQAVRRSGALRPS